MKYLPAMAALIAALGSGADAAAAISRIFPPMGDALNGQDMFCVDSASGTRVTCPDAVVRMEQQSTAVMQPFERGDFGALDATFQRWRNGGTRFEDGSWELALLLPGLENAFKTAHDDSAKLARWRAREPDSTAAMYVEAWMWCVHARRVKGGDPHVPASPEAEIIASERLAKAAQLVRVLKRRIGDSPAWLELQIALLLEQGRPAKAREAFDMGIRRFPHYHPLYFRMSSAYTGPAFDKFASQAAAGSAQFEGQGMYARIYQQVDTLHGMPFDPERGSMPDWSALQAGYEDLMQRYPKSILLATGYASVLCRSNDPVRYRQMRTQADQYFIADMFKVVPVEACDRRHGWVAAPQVR